MEVPPNGANPDSGYEETRALLDGASPGLLEIPSELELQKRVACDPLQPQEQRLDAFETIFDSEVGDTNLVRARNVERDFNLRQIYLKFEGANPTGTQKDRIAFAQTLDALRRGYDTICVATCGNYGVAIALAASWAGLRSRIFIPGHYHTKRIGEMEGLGAEIVRVAGSYEVAVEKSQAESAQKEFYDANPGGVNTPTQLRAYGQIAYEIYDDLRDAPVVVAVPVSNGTTLAGIYRGFLSLYRRGKTSRIPRMIAGSSFRKNPIVEAFQKNLPSCIDLDPHKIKESSVNEPLVNWRSLDGDAALAAIRESGGSAHYVTDKDLMTRSRFLLKKEGLNVLAAATAGLVALTETHKKSTCPSDRYVIVLTGRKE